MILGGKLLNIYSMHVNGLTCARLKGSEGESFRREGCIIPVEIMNEI